MNTTWEPALLTERFTCYKAILYIHKMSETLIFKEEEDVFSSSIFLCEWLFSCAVRQYLIHSLSHVRSLLKSHVLVVYIVVVPTKLFFSSEHFLWPSIPFLCEKATSLMRHLVNVRVLLLWYTVGVTMKLYEPIFLLCRLVLFSLKYVHLKCY